MIDFIRKYNCYQLGNSCKDQIGVKCFLILSSSSMSQKFGWAVGGAIAGWLLAAFGYNADIAEQSESAIYGVRLMMSYLPGVSCILAVIAISLYPLGEKKMQEVTDQLNKRRKAHDQME